MSNFFSNLITKQDRKRFRARLKDFETNAPFALLYGRHLEMSYAGSMSRDVEIRKQRHMSLNFAEFPNQSPSTNYGLT